MYCHIEEDCEEVSRKEFYKICADFNSRSVAFQNAIKYYHDQPNRVRIAIGVCVNGKYRVFKSFSDKFLKKKVNP